MNIFLWAVALIVMLVSGFYAYRFSHGLSNRPDLLSSIQRWAFTCLLAVFVGTAICVVWFFPWGAA